jgi:hypothetical protein
MAGGGVYPNFSDCLLTAGAAGNERTKAMSDTTRLDQIDEEILSYEVSDEALETAAGTGKEKAGNYTLGFCSGLSVCPA